MALSYLLFNKLKWFNKKDHLVVPTTITIKPGAITSAWHNQAQPNDPSAEIVTETKTVKCSGVYTGSYIDSSGEHIYTTYAFNDTVTTKQYPNGSPNAAWVRADSNVIPNWGGKSHRIYWYQAFKSLFLAREVA